MNTIEIKAPLTVVRDFLLKPELVLRLNPSWHLKEIKAADNNSYAVILYDDRTDDSSRIILNIEGSEGSVNYIINSSTIEFSMHEVNPSVTKITVKGNFFRKEDLSYWLKGLQNYIILTEKQSSFVKWLLDRFWLRMTPSQRRITIIIIIAESVGLIALIAVVIVLKIMR
jgi:hypothetical protein